MKERLSSLYSSRFFDSGVEFVFSSDREVDRKVPVYPEEWDKITERSSYL